MTAPLGTGMQADSSVISTKTATAPAEPMNSVATSTIGSTTLSVMLARRRAGMRALHRTQGAGRGTPNPPWMPVWGRRLHGFDEPSKPPRLPHQSDPGAGRRAARRARLLRRLPAALSRRPARLAAALRGAVRADGRLRDRRQADHLRRLR